MKALPMLDHVMLWVMASFVGLLIGAACLLFLDSLIHPFFPDIQSLSLDTSSIILFLAAMLALSLFKQWNPFSRTYVIASSLLALGYAIFVLTILDPGEMTDADASSIRLSCFCLIIGFSSLLWFACQPRNPFSRSRFNSV